MSSRASCRADPGVAVDGDRGDLPERFEQFTRRGHRIYPYRLAGLTITGPDQVWCSDITYVPVQQGFLYLVR